MSEYNHDADYILGLDVSTKTIGISLFEDLGDSGKLKLLHHVTPNIKPKRINKLEELFLKAEIFQNEFLVNYAHIGIKRVVVEEPLLRSNNVNTVATLLRFNTLVCKAVYDVLGVVPEVISSHDARAFGFPELVAIRTHNKKGEKYSEKEIQKKIDKNEKVLFGAYPWDCDKKEVIWDKIADIEPQIVWLYTKTKALAKENYDMADAYTCVRGFMNKIGKWKL